MKKSILQLLKESALGFTELKEYMIKDENIVKSTKITCYTAYELKFFSSSFKRTVRLSLIDYYSHKKLSFTVYNTEGSHNSIPLYKYLKEYCGSENAEDLMLLDQYEGKPIEEKLFNFFNRIKSQLDSRFFDILKGNAWVDLPTDWHGYK